MALNINGTTGISGVDGSASAPAITGTDSNTGINFDSDIVKINTAGITRATIDSNGTLTSSNYVLQSALPSSGAYGNGSWTTISSGSGAVPVLPNTSHNVSSSYNTANGTFTCPVAGIYQIMFHTLVSTDDDSQNDNTRSFDVFFQIGGSNLARHHVKRGYQNDGDVQVTMDMTCTEIFTINTTVSLYFYANAGNQRWYGAHTYFGVTLLS